jgi:hypothetical protein
MNTKIFDLEQHIMDCWKVTDDIELITKWFVDDPKWEGMDGETMDALMNKYFAIKELYELKFEQLWGTFEEVCKEYHSRRRMSNEYEENN